MPLGLITRAGRILTARLLLGDPIDGLTHCAIGDGDATFTDPLNPPAPEIDQTSLRHERARKRYYKRTFLKEDPEGVLRVNGIRYLETTEQTQTIGVFFRFEEHEANGITIREYGFFGGAVTYADGHQDALALDGVHHPDTNPTGQVQNPGYLYELKHIPDFTKTSDTRVELVGVIKV
ncbi:hypothetical protein SCOR_15040 [Sulfidibacter corallicola]|uniref:Uncharacterized protein n=1 Tax=Sulfidibacter corallicola TaxID=2818388 RepID=A0A8A4TW82_SULCO|nr:hypothetical protein [Sulfidibacter corallicola]QTD54216.1 hypothetical protein J3U87_17360 [Sulfidibacter corallicola]